MQEKRRGRLVFNREHRVMASLIKISTFSLLRVRGVGNMRAKIVDLGLKNTLQPKTYKNLVI